MAAEKVLQLDGNGSYVVGVSDDQGLPVLLVSSNAVSWRAADISDGDQSFSDILFAQLRTTRRTR